MTDKKVIEIIHNYLSERGKWYLDTSITEDCPILQDIGEKAKEFADQRLSELSVFALYSRYKQWKKSDPIVNDGQRYFESFLSDTAFDLGRKALVGDEKAIYDESVSLNFKFITQ